MRVISNTMRRGMLARMIVLLCCLSMCLTGCDDTGESAGITDSSNPTRVVNQIIANACLGEEGEEKKENSESLSTGEVKGLTKVKDGFGIPYDEYAPEYEAACSGGQYHPTLVTDSSYEANKNRGIGYCGYESHYTGNLMSGQAHAPDHPEVGDEGAFAFTGGMLTTEEEQYGCNMRWDYVDTSAGSGGASGGVPGYMDFLWGGGPGHIQYVAIHCLASDKWCICCPDDWGPCRAQNGYPPAGSGHYGNIGGASPATCEYLGFGGERGDNSLCEFWWVENSEQVKCGPVEDLSSLTKGSSSSDKDKDKDKNKSQSASATVSVVRGATVALASDSTTSTSTSVTIEPANPNSFVDKTDSSLIRGELPKERVKYIVMHDTESGTSDGEAIIQAWAQSGNGVSAQFVVEKNGRILMACPIDKVARHAGWAGKSANEKFGLEFLPEFKDYPGPPIGPTGTEGNSDCDENVLMSYYSIGIELVHEHNEGPYPEDQLVALDRLVAYIDQYTGSKPKIIDHKTWSNQPDSSNIKQDCSDDFPLQNYQETRNHVGVTSVQEAMEAKSKHLCSDGGDKEDETSAASARLKIAKAAVQVAGTASPDDSIKGGATEKPSDPRLSTYVSAHEKGYPNDGYWASCDRSVASAIALAGVDPEYPPGPTDDQLTYCSNNPTKWKTVGIWRAGDSASVLEPGDVLITPGHTKIFTGVEAAKEKFPNTSGNMMQGSYGQFYPHISEETVAYDSREYTIFRYAGSSSGADMSDFDSLYFAQDDPRWANEPYGEVEIGPAGCGLCAACHCISILLGEEVDPPTLATKMREVDPSLSFNPYGVGTVYAPWMAAIEKIYSGQISINQHGYSLDAAKTALEQGHPFVFGIGAGTGEIIKLSNGGFRQTNGGHVMMAYKMENGNIYVKDSSASRDGIPACSVEYSAAEWERLMSGNATRLMWEFSTPNPAKSMKGSSNNDSSKNKKNKKKTKKSSTSSDSSSVKRFVFVGDSRTDQMGGLLRESELGNDFMDGELDAASSKSPDGVDELWIAKVGAGFKSWFEGTAIQKIDQNVKSGDCIFIWMGANDWGFAGSLYAPLLNPKAAEWKAKGAKVIWVTTGPFDGGEEGNNAGVEAFTAAVKSGISGDIGWIDCYSKMKEQGFSTQDGCHYTAETYQKVYDIMTKDAAVGSAGASDAEEEEEEEEEEDDEPKRLTYDVFTP